MIGIGSLGGLCGVQLRLTEDMSQLIIKSDPYADRYLTFKREYQEFFNVYYNNKSYKVYITDKGKDCWTTRIIDIK